LFGDLQDYQPKGGSVSEESSINTEEEDVELHRNKSKVQANEEQRDETEAEEDDVELHGNKQKRM
jgi:hypothetical protein